MQVGRHNCSRRSFSRAVGTRSGTDCPGRTCSVSEPPHRLAVRAGYCHFHSPSGRSPVIGWVRRIGTCGGKWAGRERSPTASLRGGKSAASYWMPTRIIWGSLSSGSRARSAGRRCANVMRNSCGTGQTNALVAWLRRHRSFHRTGSRSLLSSTDRTKVRNKCDLRRGLDPDTNGLKEKTMARTPRRPENPLDAAEALFRPAKKASPPAPKRPAVPLSRETVSIRIDADVLAFSRKMGRAGRTASMRPYAASWIAAAGLRHLARTSSLPSSVAAGSFSTSDSRTSSAGSAPKAKAPPRRGR